MKETAIIICVRKGDSSRRLVEGSVLRPCVGCGTEVHISPASLRRMESQEMAKYSCQIKCVECSIPDLKRTKILGPSTDQRMENIENGLPDVWLGRKPAPN